MFLTFGRVFQDGATEQDLLRIYRPRPGLPFTPMIVQRRSRRLMWTTFTSRQIDLDVGQPATRDYLLGVLERLAEHGVATVRLDAIGYAVKTAGTSCFMTPTPWRSSPSFRNRPGRSASGCWPSCTPTTAARST